MASQLQEPASSTTVLGQDLPPPNHAEQRLKFVPLPTPLHTSQPSTRTITVDRESAYPCRRCLADGHEGEQMLLLAYDPFQGDSPYRGAGPIFVHKEPCTPYQGMTVPEQQRQRLLSVRGYDHRHMMVNA